jgi:CO dehydrogenase nickel-insertion accessory protein CooC1
MAQKLGVRHIAAIINKVNAPEQIEAVKSQLKDLAVLGAIDYDRQAQKADLCRQSVYQSSPQMVDKLSGAKEALIRLLGTDKG